jgi:DNA-binding transcriptional ArsR family regulator
MDLSSPPSAVTGSVLQAAVLAVLAGTTKPLTGRQVARLSAHGSTSGVQRVLDRLVEHGLVEAREAPPAVLYELNRDHVAAPIVEALVGLRGELLDRLRAALASWDPAPAHASLFGSAARGDGGIDSDIDLFLVRPAHVDADSSGWRAQLDALAADVARWTGNHAGISEVDEADVARLAAERPPVVEELMRDAVTLTGASPGRLFAEKP